MSEENDILVNALLTSSAPDSGVIQAANSQQTAKKAAKILEGKGAGFVIPTAKQKRLLLVAFAKRNFVIYGKAFDILKTTTPLNLDDENDITVHLDSITLYEIKSTNKNLDNDFNKYFFALTTAELLVAQNLKARYKFALVNTVTEEYIELTLSEIFARAKGIYPTWSIMF